MNTNYCPNVNTKEYKRLAQIVGDASAHNIYKMNKGNHVEYIDENNKSKVYEELIKTIGEEKAYRARIKMFSEDFKRAGGNPNGTYDIVYDSAVVMPNGQLYELGDKEYISPKVAEILGHRERIQASQDLNIIIKALRKSIPGLNIIVESYDSVKGTKYENKLAWISKNGIHFNTQYVSYDSPIHELGHIWLLSMKNINENMFNTFMEKIKESINQDNTIYRIIAKQYPELNETDLLFEYAATLIGLKSVNEIKHYLLEHGKVYSENKIIALFERTVEAIKEFLNNVVKLISKVITKYDTSELGKIDFNRATLDDIVKAFTNDILYGRGIHGINASEIKRFMDRYDGEDMYSKEFRDIKGIEDITPYLLGNEEYKVGKHSKYDDPLIEREEAYKIYSTFKYKDNNNNYVYWEYNKRYEFKSTNSEEQIIREIIDTVIANRKILINNFSAGIFDAIVSYKRNPSKPLREHIRNAFSEGETSKFPENITEEIERTLQIMGVKDKIKKIMYYSDLKNDPELSYLYKEVLEGNNPIVLIHDTSNGIDMSLIDLSPTSLGYDETFILNGEYHIGANMGISPVKGKSYSNDKADIRKIILTATIAGMNKLANENNTRIKIRKTGIISFTGFKVKVKMITSLQQAFKNAHHIYNHDVFRALYDRNKMKNYDWFMSLLEDEKYWSEKNILQSWKAKLESFYLENYKKLGLPEDKYKELTENIYSFEHIKFVEKRIREIERANNYDIERLYNNDEHKILSQYHIYSKIHKSINNAQIQDINRTFKNLMSVHDINSDIIQYFSIVAEASKSKIVYEVETYKEKLHRLIKASKRSRGISDITTDSKAIFGHLFKQGTAIINKDDKENKAGDYVDVTLYNQIYGSYNIEEARAAGLTKEDIELCDYILETVRERYIQNELQENSRKNTPIKEEDIIKRVNERLRPGYIPVLKKTSEEEYRKGHFLKAFKIVTQKQGKNEFKPGDEFEIMYDEVHSIFSRQLDESSQWRLMGVKFNKDIQNDNDINNEMVINSIDYYNDHTINLEYIFDMFVYDSVRIKEVQNVVYPAYNNALQWMYIIKHEHGYSQKYTEDFLNEYKVRIINKETMDQKTDKLNPFIRNATAFFSFVSLGYKPLIWLRSGYYNSQNQWLMSLAESALKDDPSGLPTGANMAKAHKIFYTEMRKAFAIAKKLSVINQNEHDVIDSVYTTMTDKTILKQQYAQLGNYYTDAAARVISMIAYMVKDGSWEAHTYDNKTGELTYDVTKDARYYEAGTWKNENAKILYNNKLKVLKEIGLANENKVYIGYTFEDSNLRFKWYSDKYIIGSMDEYQKMMLGNHAVGSLFTQFRFYAPDKIMNAVGSKRSVSYGTIEEVIENEEGDIEIIRKQIEIEGTIAAIGTTIKDVVEWIKNKDRSLQELKDIFLNADRSTKRGQIIALAKIMLYTTIVTGISMFAKGLSDRDKRKISFLYTELLTLSLYDDIFNNIIPMTRIFEDIYSLILGEGNWQRIMMRYTFTGYDILQVKELFGPIDNLTPSIRERREMNEKEKQIKEAKLEKAKLQKEYNRRLEEEEE